MVIPNYTFLQHQDGTAELIIFNDFAFEELSASEQYLRDSVNTITIHPNITRIPDRAFFRYSNVTTLTLPEGLQSIGDNAFQLTGLSSVILPNGLQSIGIAAFSHCGNLRYIALPKNLAANNISIAVFAEISDQAVVFLCEGSGLNLADLGITNGTIITLADDLYH